MAQFGQIFKFVKLPLFLETHSGGGLAPSSQTMESLLNPMGDKASQESVLSITLMDLTNSKICTLF